MRESGQLGADLRLLVDDGERHLDAATELAEALRCDVYLTPHGTTVGYACDATPNPTWDTVATWDAVALDRSTGAPSRWLTVRPSDLPPDTPTWFVSVAGHLRQSAGLVSVPLPDGIAFATRASFPEVAATAARLTDLHAVGAEPAAVTTIAVGAELGRFEIRRFSDAGSLLGGVEFATLVAASLDVVRPDVQIALTWPAQPDTRIALDQELMRLADALNRTVWVPDQGGSAVVASTAATFAALDDRGGPGRWKAYRSRLNAADSLRYSTDADGLLVRRAVDPDDHHGVPGLPEQVVRWPDEDQRADTPAYLVLPGSERSGFVALSRTRPALEAGSKVLEVKVRRRRMIDVPATVAAHFATGESSDFAAFAGEDLVLPAADIARAVVTKVWWYGEDGRPRLGKLDRGTLAEHLEPASTSS
jgi:hypothetical protein